MILREAPIEVGDDKQVNIPYCSVCLKESTPKKPLPHKHLLPFEPPVCEICHQHLRNVTTINGKRIYACITFGCTNNSQYDLEGNKIGQRP